MYDFLVKIQLLFTAVFFLSAQSIKLQSVKPVSDGTEQITPSLTQNLINTSEISAAEFVPVLDSSENNPNTEIVEESSTTVNKFSLKNFAPMKEGTVVLKRQNKQDNKTISTQNKIKNSLKSITTTDFLNKSSSTRESYSKKKNVHLKNFNPLGETPEIVKTNWQLKQTTHFKIYYEAEVSALANAIAMDAEQLYQTMRLNVAVFPNWMAAEPASIYIYATKEAFAAGEFKPAFWMQALAYPDKKIVAVYSKGSINKLKPIIAHELTHVYFESFFSMENKKPPLWLNEGLAVSIENKFLNAEEALGSHFKSYPYETLMPFSEFFKSSLSAEDISEDAVTSWYLQAFATVTFLQSYASQLSFKNFCTQLRNGKSEKEALWSAYRFSDIDDFNNKFLAWLAVKGGKDNAYSEFNTSHSKAGASNMPKFNKPMFLPKSGEKFHKP